MYQLILNSEHIHGLKQIYTDCHNIILAASNTFIYADMVFTNNTDRISQEVADYLKHCRRELVNDNIYFVIYRGFKIFRFYYSNIKNKLFYRDLIYRRAYNPANLQLFDINIYKPITPGQPKNPTKSCSYPQNNHIKIGTIALNYYLNRDDEDIAEYITDDSENMINIPIYDDINLRCRIEDNAIYYNSAQYELIPHHCTYASPLVIIRFLVVRMYIYKYILNKPIYDTLHLHNECIDLIHKSTKLFPQTCYGTYVDPRLFYKK